MAVTVLMLISIGENIVLAIRSHIIQKAPPPMKDAGIITIGFAVPKRLLIR